MRYLYGCIRHCEVVASEAQSPPKTPNYSLGLGVLGHKLKLNPTAKIYKCPPSPAPPPPQTIELSLDIYRASSPHQPESRSWLKIGRLGVRALELGFTDSRVQSIAQANS